MTTTPTDPQTLTPGLMAKFAPPIERFRPPSSITGQLNGAVDRALLEPVEEHNTAYTRMMVHEPARAMRALIAYMGTVHGIVLTTTGRGRTLQSQWDIFGGYRRRWEPCTRLEYLAAQLFKRGRLWTPADRAIVIERLGPQRVPIPDATYWRKIRNPNGSWPYNSATPGTSNHGWWCADDIAERVDGELVAIRPPTFVILYTVAPRYGFAWQTVADPPHVHWTRGDVIPEAVLEFEEGEMITALAAIFVPTPGKVSAGNTKWFALMPGGHVRHASGSDTQYAQQMRLPFLPIESDDHYQILVDDWQQNTLHPAV